MPLRDKCHCWRKLVGFPGEALTRGAEGKRRVVLKSASGSTKSSISLCSRLRPMKYLSKWLLPGVQVLAARGSLGSTNMAVKKPVLSCPSGLERTPKRVWGMYDHSGVSVIYYFLEVFVYSSSGQRTLAFQCRVHLFTRKEIDSKLVSNVGSF